VRNADCGIYFNAECEINLQDLKNIVIASEVLPVPNLFREARQPRRMLSIGHAQQKNFMVWCAWFPSLEGARWIGVVAGMGSPPCPAEKL